MPHHPYHPHQPQRPHPRQQAYPYFYPQSPPQGYVGPQAFAPAFIPAFIPPCPAPARPKKKGIGCVGWVFLLMGLGVLFGGCVVVGAALLFAGGEDGPTADNGDGKVDPNKKTGAATGAKPDAGAGAAAAGVVTPSAKGGTVATLTGRNLEVDNAFAKGTCNDDSKERNRSTYQATRGGGSARHMRGKVAALQIRLGTRKQSWTPKGEIRVENASLAAGRFFSDEAKRHRVTGLSYEVIPWTLVSPYQLPSLTLQANNTLPTAVVEEIERGSKAAVETALGKTLAQMTKELRAKGYDEVSFIIYFPAESKVRDWARPAAGGGRAELGYIFSPLSTGFGDFAWVISHESMHLFGADDLYRLRDVDEDDKGDIMNAYCTGFARAHIGAATSYAIGWRDTKPARRYQFQDF